MHVIPVLSPDFLPMYTFLSRCTETTPFSSPCPKQTTLRLTSERHMQKKPLAFVPARLKSMVVDRPGLQKEAWRCPRRQPKDRLGPVLHRMDHETRPVEGAEKKLTADYSHTKRLASKAFFLNTTQQDLSMLGHSGCGRRPPWGRLPRCPRGSVLQGFGSFTEREQLLARTQPGGPPSSATIHHTSGPTLILRTERERGGSSRGGDGTAYAPWWRAARSNELGPSW